MSSVDWSLIVDEVLLFAVGTLKLLLWLILRRRTVVGRAIASSTLAMSIVYYGALLAIHFAAFRSDAWRISIRALVAITTFYALWAIAGHFGGWLGLAREVRRGVGELGDAARDVGRLLIWRWRRRTGGTRSAVGEGRERRVCDNDS